MRRRQFLHGMLALAGAGSSSMACSTSVARPPTWLELFLCGYFPEHAFPAGKPATRSIAGGDNDRQTLITHLTADSLPRQGVLPTAGHQVVMQANCRHGVMCAFEAGRHILFDRDSLEPIVAGQTPGIGWRGGGHGTYLDAQTLLTSERAPRMSRFDNDFARRHGRIAVRDADTLRIVEHFDSFGIDPHDICLIPGTRQLAIANYGSVPPRGARQLGVPREVVAPSVSVIDLDSGRLVERWVMSAGDCEVRHLCAGHDGRLFAIQVRLGADKQPGSVDRRKQDSRRDITTLPGEAYLPAAVLTLMPGEPARELGNANEQSEMRQGLSIVHDARHQEIIATFPSSHRIMVFSARDGQLLRQIDTREHGLHFPCGLALLPDGEHYAVSGYWENLHILARGSHIVLQAAAGPPKLFGHSHLCAPTSHA